MPRTDANGKLQKPAPQATRPPPTNGNGKAPNRDLPPLIRAIQGIGLKQLIPAHMDQKRMFQVFVTAHRTVKDLALCTPESFVGSVLSAAQLGLEPNTPLGHCYLVPYRNRREGTTECQIILGYQGMMELARRSKLLKSIMAHAVFRGDEFHYELGLNPNIVHRPDENADHTPENITHVYAVAKLLDGGEQFVVLTRKEVDRFQPNYNSNFWRDHYQAMAMKTAVRRLFTWLPKSIHMAQGAALDEAANDGRTQAAHWSPEVIESMQSEGYEAPQLTEGSPNAAPADVAAESEASPVREPGMEG